MYKKIWDTQTLLKSAYNKCMAPVCQHHQLTKMELAILLFLANNPEYDTASDIVDKRKFAKSHVSTSVKSLEKRGFLIKKCQENNRKTVHLKLCRSALQIVIDGQAAQKKFGDLLFQNFTDKDIKKAWQLFSMCIQNIEHFLSEDYV